MRKIFAVLFVLFSIAIPLSLQAGRFEWQLSAGTWTLQPFTSPVTTAATRLVQEETDQLLAPLLSEYTFFSFQPEIKLDSRGYFFSVAAWYNLAAGRFALGASASYLHFTLPFLLSSEQDFFVLNFPVAHVSTRGEGHIDLRTVMLKAQGRWRISHGRRISIFASLGLTLIPFNGDLYLPLKATIESILGNAELTETEATTIAQLRAENSDIPALILSPTLAISLHYRLAKKIQLFSELSLSPGTYLSAGLSLGR
jgi:hypothetical protein